MENRLAVRDLVKCYGAVRAAQGVSFEVGPGEILGLLGPNGAGKTTVIECALGLRTQDSGAVEITGERGAVLQSTALQDAITPREALELFGAFYPRPISATVLLERFGLVDKADARFETLSGGQRQRLALALAFVNDPGVLFLDEPTSGLDPQLRRELHESIRQARSEGRAVLLTTHYIEEAHALCDRIAILHQGRIVAQGTPDELIARSAAGTRLIVRTARNPDPASIEARDTGPAIIDLVKKLAASGDELLDLQVKKPSLEDVFIELTGEGI